MTSIENNDTYITSAYAEGKSCYEIAEELHSYANSIRRRLKVLGVPLRGRSEAQKSALETGRSKSPTAGIGHSDETKLKLAEKSHAYWESLTPAKREKLRKRSKKVWKERPLDFDAKATKGNLKAAKDGSALEHYIVSKLTEKGYKVLFHHVGLIDEKLEVDMFLPELNLAIEIDGPSHFLPIWGQDSLNKTIQSDAKKNAQLINKGVKVVRVKNPNRHMPLWRMQKISENLIDTIEKVRYSKSKKNFIEIDA